MLFPVRELSQASLEAAAPDGCLHRRSCVRSNLAGHNTITGDLPAEWYDQSKFPKLWYLKLKGTQIKPALMAASLTWSNEGAWR